MRRIFLAALVLMLAACAYRDPLVGWWSGDDMVLVLGSTEEGQQFVLTWPGQLVTGTWEADESTLTLHSTFDWLDLAWAYPYELLDDVLIVGGTEFHRG